MVRQNGFSTRCRSRWATLSDACSDTHAGGAAQACELHRKAAREWSREGGPGLGPAAGIPGPCQVAAGTTAGFAPWFVGFVVVGGEWFRTWQSRTWNGREGCVRLCLAVLGIAVYAPLDTGDDELAGRHSRPSSRTLFLPRREEGGR